MEHSQFLFLHESEKFNILEDLGKQQVRFSVILKDL
jgi:hypothetical protein